MTSKFLYFKKKETFDSLVSSIPEGLSPICFIEDSNEIWFNNHFFQAGHESLSVEEMDNTVIVSLSESSFKIAPGTSNIQIGASNNTITVSSNALTKIDTDDQLEWSNAKLKHKESGVEAGTYGQSAATTGANILDIPKITVNKYGHVTALATNSVTIKDYVEQRKADAENKNRQILLAESTTEENNTNITRKAGGLTYNNSTQTLNVKNIKVDAPANGGIVVTNGNIEVVNGTFIGKFYGEVTGTATPKIHLSSTPEYGGASTNLYGHVRLVDEISGVPARSSDNSDTTDEGIVAVAASPYLVYNYVNANKFKATGVNASGTKTEVTDELEFTNDFNIDDKKVSISWKEIQ